MTSNIEICLEELDAGPDDACFIRCVAISGGQPGLALDRDGLVRWMPDNEAACHGLWVSADGRLMLYGAAAAGAAVVERGPRTQVAPAGKPVVLIDQDLLRVGDRRLRVHVHGETEALYEPERLSRSAVGRFLHAAAAAASLTLGSAALADRPAAQPGGVGEPPPIEVRRRPPRVAPRKRKLDCAIAGQHVKDGRLHVEARCSSTKKLRIGQYGTLSDSKSGKQIKNGAVKISAIRKGSIEAMATQLDKRAKADTIRFWVR